MQISSVNTGAVSGPGLPIARKAVVELPANAPVDVSSAVNARALQQVAPPVALANTSVSAANDADASHALVLAHQRGGREGLFTGVRAARPENDIAAQRAVMAYNNVATQEQHFALTGVLAGIDVFA